MDKRKRDGQTNCLTSWLKRSKTNGNETLVTENIPTPAKLLPILKCSAVQVPSNITSCNISDTEFSSDIGNFLPGTNMSDFTKVKLLEMSNIPPNNFVYPYSIHTKKAKKKNVFLNERILNNIIGFIIQLPEVVYFVSTVFYLLVKVVKIKLLH